MDEETPKPTGPFILSEDQLNELMLTDTLLEPFLEELLKRPEESGLVKEDFDNIWLLKREFFPRVRFIFNGGKRVGSEFVEDAVRLSGVFSEKRKAFRYSQMIEPRGVAAASVDMALWKASLVLKQIVAFLEEEARKRGFI